MGFIGISLFFIISGFMLAKKYPKQEKFSIKWFLKRYIKVAVLYYLALVAISFLFSKQVYSGSLTKNLVYHFLFLDFTSGQTIYGIISPAWFLIPLMILYFLYPYLNNFIKKSPYYLVIAFILMIIVRIAESTYTSYCPIFFLGEFCFGIALAHNLKNKALFSPLLLVLVNPLMIIPFFIAYIFASIKIEKPTPKIVKLIAANTLALFLFHEVFIRVILKEWKLGDFNIFTSLSFLVLISIGLVYISKKTQKFILKKYDLT